MNNIFKKIFSLIKYITKNNALSYKNLIINAKILSNLNKKKKINNLSEVEWSAFSQFGEDGIIDWLINFLPDIPKKCVEFGVSDYFESNTRFLVENRNWSSFLIECDKNSIKNIKNDQIFWKKNISIKESFITKDNINNLISELISDSKIGLLSIDIDGNDYWVWKNINIINPSIVICEFNSLFGDKLSLTIPYSDEFNRTKSHFSNQYFGASIKALISLAKTKRYEFIGTPSTGVNAFFIRSDLVEKILPNIINVEYFRSSHNDSVDINGKFNFFNYENLLKQLKNKPLIDLKNNKNIKIGDYLNKTDLLYSEDWIR